MKRNASNSSKISRRTFIAAGAITLGVACATPFVGLPKRRRIPGSIVGGNSSLGHAFRDGKLPPISETTEVNIVIVGGGISGLSAARQLQRRGISDFVLLELESHV